MSVTPKLIETKVHSEETVEERKRYQFRDEDGGTVLNLDTIDDERYASNWHVPFGDVDPFEDLIQEHYADPSSVETQAVYRAGEEEVGGKLISTYDRVTDYERHPTDCVYLEFRYGPHTLAWSAEADGGQISLSVEGGDVEPLRRFLAATLDLPDEAIQDTVQSVEDELEEDFAE
jgi:8-oxo-dGTP pyrophosphatase MutT (NUDIX family)